MFLVNEMIHSIGVAFPNVSPKLLDCTFATDECVCQLLYKRLLLVDMIRENPHLGNHVRKALFHLLGCLFALSEQTATDAFCFAEIALPQLKQ